MREVQCFVEVKYYQTGFTLRIWLSSLIDIFIIFSFHIEMSGGRLLAFQARLLSAVPNNKTREIRNLKVFAYKVTRDIGFKTFIALSFSLKPSSKFLISFVKI